MNVTIRRTLRALIILAVIIFLARSPWVIILLGVVGILAGIARTLYKRFGLKHPIYHDNNMFSHPTKPAGVPPGPSSHNEDFDIIVDPQTNKEYRISKRKP